MGKRSEEIIKRLSDSKSIFGIEIGVRYGKNAEQILQAVPNLYMWLVDTWKKPPSGDSYYKSDDGIADRPQGYWRKCWRDFKNRIRPYENRVEIVPMRSIEAAEFFRKHYRDNLFDFIFIDADHSYNGVLQDIRTWYPFVKPGGFIGGHDYGHPRIGEVEKAVNEVFGKENLDLGSDHTWFVRKWLD